MKREFLIFSLLILTFSCSTNEKKMIVSGNIDGLKKGTIYLQKQQDSIIVSIDSILGSLSYQPNSWGIEHPNK